MITAKLLFISFLVKITSSTTAPERFKDSDRYNNNYAEVFHHGEVQTPDTATIEELYNHGLMDKPHDYPQELKPKSRPPKPRPGPEGFGFKYMGGAPGQKITLMKTYYDPYTNQPYMYVMRKRPKPQQLEEGDSFFSTASKLISTFLGPDEIYKPRMVASRGLKEAAPKMQRLKRVPRSLNTIMNSYHSENTVNNIQKIRSHQVLSEGRINNDLLLDPVPVGTHHENNEEKLDINGKGDEIFSTTNTGETVNNRNKYKMENVSDEANPSSFEESIKVVHRLMTKCGRNFLSPKDNVSEIYNKIKDCVQKHVLKAFDRMLSSDYIPLSDGVLLVRDKNSPIRNDTSTGRSDIMSGTFFSEVSERMFRLLQSHSLQLRLWDSAEVVEGRRRHHYRKAFPMMVAGYMMLSAFLVPLGFQFMAMIGGKALLLSKMALMMSMLGGFKKLLTPDPIYHLPTPGFEHSSLGWHRSTREPTSAMTQAFAKTNQAQTSHWIDPKTYSLYR